MMTATKALGLLSIVLGVAGWVWTVLQGDSVAPIGAAGGFWGAIGLGAAALAVARSRARPGA